MRRATPAAAAAFLQRIEEAADAVCGGAATKIATEDKADYETCRSDALSAALARLRNPVISGLAATGAMLLTGIAAWLSVRRKMGSGLIEQLASVPLVIPGVVLGVAVLEISLNYLPGLYGTVWIVALAFLIRYMPYGMRYGSSGVIQIHRELEEAAAASGATQASMLRRILLPLLSPSLVAGWLFIFLLGAKELSIAVLLAGPDSQTISVAMFDQWANGASGEVSAMGVIWTSIMTVFTLGLFMVTKRRGSMLAGKPG